jgi:hypothetical protein
MTVDLRGDFGDCTFPYCGTEEMDVSLFADLLIWSPSLGGLESAFGYTSISTAVSEDHVTTTLDERDVEPDYPWYGGIQFGVNVNYECYKLSCYATLFEPTSQFREPSETGTLPSTFALGVNDSQHGQWQLQYDTLNFLFGRYWNIAPALFVQPYFGLRGLWVDQTLNGHLQTVSTSPSGETLIYTDFNNREKIWGIGPLVGIEAVWVFKYHFSVYADFDFVYYYGRVKGSYLDFDIFTTLTGIKQRNATHNFTSLATDTAFGMRWDLDFECCSYDLKLLFKAAWEEQRIYDFSDLGSDGTLSVGGFTFGAGIQLKI